MDGGSAMDMMEQRIREVLATLLSKGAQVLERTAGELAQAATDLRQERARADAERVDAERVWAEKPERESGTTIRGAPLRAVPDTPTDERPTTDDRIAQIASGTVSQIRAQLAGLSTDELRELRDVEAATRNRATLLSAIDRVLAEDH
jgi:hypothetical protein